SKKPRQKLRKLSIDKEIETFAAAQAFYVKAHRAHFAKLEPSAPRQTRKSSIELIVTGAAIEPIKRARSVNTESPENSAQPAKHRPGEIKDKPLQRNPHKTEKICAGNQRLTQKERRIIRFLIIRLRLKCR
ncbi:MAG: hypothetical protein PWR01_4420, partial [Clostridiales bacterium]|nr:hypothetical protein [Clostridiales bacterium]MDN5283347.1 hypothetical protein [Candidatus Ozemobacter sp.]